MNMVMRAQDGLENIRASVPAHCIYCDGQRTVTVYLRPAERHGTSEALCNWLDAQAAARCPCLGDILFNVGHKATRRRLVREALADANLNGLDRKPEYRERMTSLHQAWVALQPKAK